MWSEDEDIEPDEDMDEDEEVEELEHGGRPIKIYGAAVVDDGEFDDEGIEEGEFALQLKAFDKELETERAATRGAGGGNKQPSTIASSMPRRVGQQQQQLLP